LIGVVGYWDLNDWYYISPKVTPKALKERVKHWTYVLKSFGIKNLIFIDVDESFPMHGDKQINIEIYSTLDEVIKKYSDHKLVFFVSKSNIPEEYKAISLKEYMMK